MNKSSPKILKLFLSYIKWNNQGCMSLGFVELFVHEIILGKIDKECCGRCGLII